MTLDLSRVIYSSTTNAYKNTGVKTSSINLTGTVAAGTFATFETTIVLTETQNYGKLFIYVTDFFSSETGWFNARASALINTSGPATTHDFWLGTKINGDNVTVYAQLFNPYGSTLTLTDTTVPIIYITYTTEE